MRRLDYVEYAVLRLEYAVLRLEKRGEFVVSSIVALTRGYVAAVCGNEFGLAAANV